MNMWEDYYEPSEFEQEIESLKQSIRDNVRKEIQDEMDKLRAENSELREVKANWQVIKREHAQALRDLRIAKENAEREAKKAKAKDIFAELAVIGYRPSVEYETGPKCDKCDERRYRHFISPLGREMIEECTCKKTKRIYSPAESKLVRFWAGKGIGSVFYKRTEDKDIDSDRYDSTSDVYKALPDDLSKIDKYRAVFINKDDCQRYCDSMNAQEEEKANERKA